MARVKTAPLSHADPDLEGRLTKRGVTWTLVVDVPTSTFDLDKSLRNQSRLGELDEPTVSRYVHVLEAGDSLPALVAWEDKRSGKYVIVSGNHRLEAFIRVGLPVAVYVIEAPSQTILELTFTENLQHGLPPTEAERYRQALQLVENKMAASTAARLLMVSPRKLDNARAALEGKRKAAEWGIKPTDWDRLHAGVQEKLLTTKTDEGFAALTKLALDAGLSADEVKETLTSVNATKSADAQTRLIAELRGRVYQPRIAGGGNAYVKTRGKNATARSTAERAVTLVRHLPDPEAIAGYYTDLDAREAMEHIDDAIAKLRRLKAVLGGK